MYLRLDYSFHRCIKSSINWNYDKADSGKKADLCRDLYAWNDRKTKKDLSLQSSVNVKSVVKIDWRVLCLDNEASAGSAEQQQLDYRAEAESPAGAGVSGASGNPEHLHSYTFKSSHLLWSW